MKLLTLCKTLIATTALGAALAHADVVTFTGDPTGAKANGFTSGGVVFNDTNGTGLQLISGYAAECGNAANNCLANFGDDSGALQMIFNNNYTILSLDFGNDDAGYMPADGLALLQLFKDGVQVGEASLMVNLDDIMNQTLSYTGAAFNSARFTYTDAGKNPVGLIEVVDNINYDGVVPTDIPEPGTLALLGIALAGLARQRRRTR